MHIRTKAILLVLLIIACLATVYLSVSISHRHQDLQNEILAKKKSTLFLAKTLQEQAFAHYRTRVISLATSKPKVIEAFAKRDRVQLEKAVGRFYATLKKENPYFHAMQFNLPDGTSFFRVHLPDFYGDNLSTVRPILNYVHSTREQASGYDVGRQGLFYRVVQPMFYQGEYIGSIGFGIKYNQLLDLLQKEVSPHIALVMSGSQWQKVTRSQAPVAHHGDDVILHMGDKFFSEILLTDFPMGREKIQLQGRDFALFSDITLNDFQNQPLAKILVALDVTDELAQLHNFIIKIILLTVAILAITALILYFSFGQLLNTILDLNNSLAQVNTELEDRIEMRTAELAESNVSLKNEMAERERIEAELRQAQKMRAIGTLASGIAHDFNNILTAILGFTQLAILKLAPGQDITLHLNKIEQAGMRAKDLVAQILSFGRQSEQQRQSLELQPMIKETLKLLRASIPANINIVQHLAADCSPILADPTQLHQVLMNLCTNAYHAMEDQEGTLTVSLSQVEIIEQDTSLGLIPGSYLKLEIEDTGSGIESDVLERIFEPYFTTKEPGKGTGLGLAVVHGIIKSYKGHIMAQSTPGQGTVFIVLLPCYHGEEEAFAVLPPDNVVHRGKGERLLVVDDEKVILVFWELLLGQMGYQVTAIEDAPTAYHWLTEHVAEIDGIITDLSMPHMTGLELSKKIREFAPSMPIALCSGYSTPDLQKKAQDLLIKAFIKKPVDNVQLSQALRTLFS